MPASSPSGAHATAASFFFFLFSFSRKLPARSPREFSLEAPGPGERQREKNTVSQPCTGVGDVQDYKPCGFGCCQPQSSLAGSTEHPRLSPITDHSPEGFKAFFSPFFPKRRHEMAVPSSCRLRSQRGAGTSPPEHPFFARREEKQTKSPTRHTHTQPSGAEDGPGASPGLSASLVQACRAPCRDMWGCAATWRARGSAGS